MRNSELNNLFKNAVTHMVSGNLCSARNLIEKAMKLQVNFSYLFVSHFIALVEEHSNDILVLLDDVLVKHPYDPILHKFHAEIDIELTNYRSARMHNYLRLVYTNFQL